MNKKLKRPCKKCEKYFRPTGKSSRMCEKCLNESMKHRLKKKHNE